MKLLRITTVPISLQLLLTGQFRYMREHGYEVTTISAEGSGVEDVLKEGVKHIAIPFTRKITPIQDLKCLLELVSVIKKIKPNIIHTHTPKAGLLGMLAGKICGVPVRMHTVAGLPLMESSGLKRWLLAMTERITYAAAHRVYPNSKGLENFMKQELGVKESKLGMIGKGSSNGIDTEYFSSTPELKEAANTIRSKYKISDDDVVFSFVGRVVKDKGITELVSAFRQVSDTRQLGKLGERKFFLMIVGPFEESLDPLPFEVMRFLKEDPRVILAGFQRDIRPWLLASDIFVFPSYREGFPNVVMQAGLLEVPAIVSDINGCNEIVDNNVSGLIVPVKNAEALSDAMLKLVGDAALRKRLGSIARLFVYENYDRKYVWSEILGEYRRMGEARR